MNAKHRKTLVDIFTHPANGTMAWARIESLLIANGCAVRESKGSAVSFHKDGLMLNLHRPHPGKEPLRYRVIETREFLKELGVTP
jgi:hypothetical protein